MHLFVLTGQGWDRHLFALKAIHIEEYGDSKPLPGIFTDDAYSQINHNKISTSTLGPVSSILLNEDILLTIYVYKLLFPISQYSCKISHTWIR